MMLRLPRLNVSRERRILALSVIFFLSGASFYALYGLREREVQGPVYAPPIMKESEIRSELAKLPPPHTFRHLRLSRDMGALPVFGSCEDSYYVIMLFPASIDYRVSPLDAKYNTATECNGTSFSTAIPLGNLPLEEGGEYYLVRAHQGATGGWYTPY